MIYKTTMIASVIASVTGMHHQRPIPGKRLTARIASASQSASAPAAASGPPDEKISDDFSALHTQMCGMELDSQRKMSEGDKKKLEDEWKLLESKIGVGKVQKEYHQFLLCKAKQSLGYSSSKRLACGRMGTIFEVTFPVDHAKYSGNTLILKLPNSFTQNEKREHVWELWNQEIELYREVTERAQGPCDALVEFYEHAIDSEDGTYILMEPCDEVQDRSSVRMMYDYYRAIGYMHSEMELVHKDLLQDNCMRKRGQEGYLLIDYLSPEEYNAKNMESDIMAIKNMSCIPATLRKDLSMKIIEWTKNGLSSEEKKSSANKKICRKFGITKNPFTGATSHKMPRSNADFCKCIDTCIKQSDEFPQDLFTELQTFQSDVHRYQAWYGDVCLFIDAQVAEAKQSPDEKGAMSQVANQIAKYIETRHLKL